MARLSADFSTAFSRDLKKKARKRQGDLSKLKEVIELVIDIKGQVLQPAAQPWKLLAHDAEVPEHMMDAPMVSLHHLNQAPKSVLRWKVSNSQVDSYEP